MTHDYALCVEQKGTYCRVSILRGLWNWLPSSLPVDFSYLFPFFFKSIIFTITFYVSFACFLHETLKSTYSLTSIFLCQKARRVDFFPCFFVDLDLFLLLSFFFLLCWIFRVFWLLILLLQGFW